jgi:hypothetical protein
VSVTKSSVFLLNVESGLPEPAELWDAITEQQLADWEAEWSPELLKAIQRLHRAGVPRKFWPQSRHWNWREKARAIQGILAHPSYSIMCVGVTQGMMILNTASKRCRLEPDKGKNLVYVDYLENAPWNRKELLDPPRFRGTGSLLMRSAIELSRVEGFRGRVGLHALPQSNDFYATKCGMSDFGVDPDPNYRPMHYFELSTEQSDAFIAKGERS